MSLLQLDYDIIPFTFADVLILRYLIGMVDEYQTVQDFALINSKSQLNWSFKSQVRKFIYRFFKKPYHEDEKQWLQDILSEHGISVKNKLSVLSKLL